MFSTFVVFVSLVVQTTTNVSWSRAATAQATASTRRAATNASVARATNTRCSTADPRARVSAAASAPPASGESRPMLHCSCPVLVCRSERVLQTGHLWRRRTVHQPAGILQVRLSQRIPDQITPPPHLRRCKLSHGWDRMRTFHLSQFLSHRFQT